MIYLTQQERRLVQPSGIHDGARCLLLIDNELLLVFCVTSSTLLTMNIRFLSFSLNKSGMNGFVSMLK